MATLNELITDFLAQKCIAVAGVSRSRHNAANMIYRKLRKTGYHVFSVNPKIETVEGIPAIRIWSRFRKKQTAWSS